MFNPKALFKLAVAFLLLETFKVQNVVTENFLKQNVMHLLLNVPFLSNNEQIKHHL